MAFSAPDPLDDMFRKLGVEHGAGVIPNDLEQPAAASSAIIFVAHHDGL